MKERAAGEVNPYIMTVATLTGHACLACGDGYASVLDNGPAKQAHCSAKFEAAGDLMGDPFEINTIRREDYRFHTGEEEGWFISTQIYLDIEHNTNTKRIEWNWCKNTIFHSFIIIRFIHSSSFVSFIHWGRGKREDW